jgi:hypothetical protein
MGWQIAVERRIATGRCAVCGAVGLQVSLRCETTHIKCLATVSCEACGAAFEATAGSRDGHEDLHAWMSQLLSSAPTEPRRR